MSRTSVPSWSTSASRLSRDKIATICSLLSCIMRTGSCHFHFHDLGIYQVYYEPDSNRLRVTWRCIKTLQVRLIFGYSNGIKYGMATKDHRLVGHSRTEYPAGALDTTSYRSIQESGTHGIDLMLLKSTCYDVYVGPVNEGFPRHAHQLLRWYPLPQMPYT